METSSIQFKRVRKNCRASRPEIAQVMFKKNKDLAANDLERDLFETRKKIERLARKNQLKNFYMFI